jgi:positive regulator of sigma E activity
MREWVRVVDLNNGNVILSPRSQESYCKKCLASTGCHNILPRSDSIKFLKIEIPGQEKLVPGQKNRIEY